MADDFQKQLEQLNMDTRAFQTLEDEIKKVIQELSDDANMERFRREFEKQYSALKTSHDREANYLKKCRELNDCIISDTFGVETAIRLTQEDDRTIQFQTRELEGVRNYIQIMKQQLVKDENKVQALRSTFQNLQQKLKNNQSMTSGRANEINELITEKENLQREKEALEKQKLLLDSEHDKVKERTDLETTERFNLEELLKKLKSDLSSTEEKIQKDEEKKRKQQQELERLKNEKEQLLKEREEELVQKKDQKKTIEQIDKEIMEREREKNKMNSEIVTLKKKETEDNKRIDELDRELNDFDLQLKDRKKELENLDYIYRKDVEVKYMSIQKEFLKKCEECEILKGKKDESVKEKNLLKDTIYKLGREIDEQNNMTLEDKKMIVELSRDQNNIRNNQSKAQKMNEEQNNEVIKGKKEKQKLDSDIKGYKKEISKSQKDIERLRNEKDKRGKEVLQANAKYYHLLEEIKLKDNLISEFQKKNLETEAKLKQQQNLYEAVRTDRNQKSKNLTETQEEIAELKRKYRIVMHTISQQKEDIDSKEQALTREYFKAKDLEKNCQSLEKQNTALATSIDQKEEDIKNFRNEIAKLQFIIKESEQQRVKLKEQYEMIVSERDILGTQLIRRNEELDLLYEKIKIQQSTLAKGEFQYRERLADIEMLKNTIGDQMRELKQFKKQVENIPELQREIHALHKELIEEKLKVKALSEELENPMNVHRWRKLEGTDSDAYEMITKIQTLQRRQIAKTDEVKGKDLIIKSQDKTIGNLRDVMKRQPGISEAEMITQYQETVKEKGNQLKAIESELNVQQTKANEQKYEIERLANDVKEFKRKVFELKKKGQLMIDERSREAKVWNQNIHLPEKRFVGGGFNLMSQ